jgi:hypothetical protein
MRVREDRRSRLAPELLDREPSVLACAQDRLTLLDERADQRAKLVESGPASLHVLLEGERKIGTLLELASENDERSEDESAKQRVEVGGAHGHVFRYAAGGTSPPVRESRARREAR